MDDDLKTTNKVYVSFCCTPDFKNTLKRAAHKMQDGVGISVGAYIYRALLTQMQVDAEVTKTGGAL